MKFLFDLLPILLFFIAYKSYDIYVATAVAIVAALLQTGWMWWRHGKVERMPLITLGIIVVLGGATLLLQDSTFIKWKPTAVNGLFALVFIGSQFIGRKTLLERLLGAGVTLPGPVWTRLNLAWAVFFLAMAALNLYVAYTFSEAIWVNFKLFGMLGLTLLFVIAQAFYMSRHMPDAPVEHDQP